MRPAARDHQGLGGPAERRCRGKARKLLQEVGYDGTPIVLLHQTDVIGHSNLATVAKPQLEAAGFKVDLQAMDWQTLVARRTKKDPPSQGGWHAFFTSSARAQHSRPGGAISISTPSCEKAIFGWPCDAEIERLRDAYARETDPEKRHAIADAAQAREREYPTYVQLGQFTVPTALRKNVTGLLTAPAITFWNIEKK